MKADFQETKMVPEGRWIRNNQDSFHCGLVLLRYLPKDLRSYMQKYMYDRVYLTDEIFNCLHTWSNIQKDIYCSMLVNRHSFVYLKPQFGATTVIAGMSLSLVCRGKKVRVFTNNKNEQRLFMSIFRELFYVGLEMFYNRIPQISENNSEKMAFANGGAVICLPASSRMFINKDTADVVFMDNVKMRVDPGSVTLHILKK